MLFNSLSFLIFAPCAILLYYAVPRRLKNVCLLLVSLIFYSTFGIPSLIALCLIILFTYLSAVLLSRYRNSVLLAFCIFLLAGILCSVRFMDRAMNTMFGIVMPFSLFVPAGLSFFTLNAIGYLADLYKKKLDQPLSFFETALLLSFFPVVTSGPILRADTFAKELRHEPVKLEYERIARAFVIVLWGFFMKLVVAERCALVTNTVYADPSFTGLPVILAVLCYSVQIYADFAGYSLIARGLGQAVGIAVPDNFSQPYFSRSVKEFWRRWHMSLSAWLKDYVYIPLGGSRKGRLRTDVNLMITFLVSGFWHGTGLSFLVWGAMHGVFQIIEGHLPHAKGKSKDPSAAFLHILLTFVLVSIAWVFFRCQSVSEAVSVLLRAVKPGSFGILFTDRLYELGLDARNLRILIIALILMVSVDYMQYHNKPVLDSFFRMNLPVRIIAVWLVLFLIVLSVNLSGAEFIYMQF